MKYAIIEVVNGNFFIRAEGITSLASAKTQYHARCQVLWNSQDVISAYIMIADEQLDCVERYKEYIYHEVVTPEEPEEPGE